MKLHGDLHDISHSKEYTKSFDVKYIAEIRHLGLSTYRILKDKDKWILDNKIEAQFAKWDEQWQKAVHRNKIQSEREANQNLADERNREAQERIKEINDILVHTLQIDDTVNWEALKDKKKFKIPNPMDQYYQEIQDLPIPDKPTHKTPLQEPSIHYYQPRFSFVDKLIKSNREKKIYQAELMYKNAVEGWKLHLKETEEFNQKLDNEYKLSLEEYDLDQQKLKRKYERLKKDWDAQKEQFIKNQSEHNLKVEKLRSDYFNCQADAVIEYCELVLNNSEYPESFPKDFNIEYNQDNKLFVIDYELPSPEQLPKVSEVKYILTKKELREVYISDTQLSKMYDEAIYKICLRTLHELFEADKANALDIIAFNGWVNAINKATGKKSNNCIVSIQVKKDQFTAINLRDIDPKTCFKNLKGVSASKLVNITSIQPIIQVNRDDKRFISSYDVADRLDEGYNLAIMSWEDFEHLIRELFEKEFKTNGGDVKVTQASRDGGVDAIAFDPDPIRGGKIVIQAKRYTNTVGVSAVRDLYGTVMNEGATKGILVTTSDYGSDAYDFVSNKPLTLLNGNNLLYLLEKHGHKARIDLQEAKAIASGIK